MFIPWDSLRSLLLLLGPLLVPRAIARLRSSRSCACSAKVPVRPVPRPVRPALALLALVCLAHLVASLPALAPENLFAATQSRLQIPVDVLFARVASLLRAAGPADGSPADAPPPPGPSLLSAADEALRAKFVNMENRLLYFKFGPAVLADCPFCIADEPMSYLYYALPALVTPHLVNLVALTLVTSASWTGSAGARWRLPAAIAALLVAALDAYLLASYDHQLNARALRLSDIDFFFWKARVVRFLSLAALDALAALLLFLSSTNRAFAQLPSPAERVEAATRVAASAKSRIKAMGIIKNTTLRDEDLRLRSQAYWAHEVRLMREVMEDRDVVEGVNDALSKRVDIQAILRDADVYSDGVLHHLRHEAVDDTI